MGTWSSIRTCHPRCRRRPRPGGSRQAGRSAGGRARGAGSAAARAGIEEAEVGGRSAHPAGAGSGRVGGHRGEGLEADPALDPIGCAARDLRECLLIQARHYTTEGEGKDDPDAELLPSIIRKHLRPSSRRSTRRSPATWSLAGRGGCGGELLSRLDPKPGRNYSGEEPQYITPDVYIHKVGDQYVTVLNDDGLSKLRISQHYRNALKNGASAQSKEYIQEKLRSAVWLIAPSTSASAPS